MSNTDIIEKARQKAEWHLSEYRRWQAFIESAAELQDGAEAKVAARAVAQAGLIVANGLPGVAAVSSAVISAAAPSPSHQTPTREVLRLTHELIAQIGPMTAAEIFDRLIRRGVVIGGKNPKGNLSAKFATDKSLRHDKDTGKWNRVGQNDKGPAEAGPSSVTGEATTSPDAGSRPVTSPPWIRAN